MNKEMNKEMIMILGLVAGLYATSWRPSEIEKLVKTMRDEPGMSDEAKDVLDVFEKMVNAGIKK